MSLDPLKQFTIQKLLPLSIFGFDISVTNSAFTMICTSVVLSIVLSICAFRFRVFITSRSQALLEIIFNMTNGLVEDAIGHPLDSTTKCHARYVFCIFTFILALNICGLIPGSFAPTAQFAVTFAAGITSLIVTLMISVRKHGFGILKSFVPSNVPLLIVPLIFLLELFSYFIRPITLCIRLGANMLAGHVVLEVLAFLCILSGYLGFLPFILEVGINLLEVGIIILQAYIFAVLASAYIGQAHHH